MGEETIYDIWSSLDIETQAAILQPSKQISKT